MEQQEGKKTISTPYGTGILTTTRYPSNGALAVVLNGHSERIATVSVNLDHGQPCTQSGDLPAGHFYLDANNIKGALLASLRKSGLFVETDLPHGVSGYCTYPVWKLSERESEAA